MKNKATIWHRHTGAIVFSCECRPIRGLEQTGCVTRLAVIESARQGVSLSNADLQGANLARLDLRGMDFTDADFTGALLRETRFDRAKLNRGVFRSCDISEARMTATDIRGCDFRGAKFEETDLRSARQDRTTQFNQSTVDRAWVGVKRQVRAAAEGGLRWFVMDPNSDRRKPRWIPADQCTA